MRRLELACGAGVVGVCTHLIAAHAVLQYTVMYRFRVSVTTRRSEGGDCRTSHLIGMQQI
jgi:hypothetical protein